MRKNLIKGLDRLSLVLCIPIAIYGFLFVRDEYTYRKAVDVTQIDEIVKLNKEKLLIERPSANVFDVLMCEPRCNEKGVIIKGSQGLMAGADSLLFLDPLFKARLQEALQRGADVAGDWIEKKTFGLKEDDFFVSENATCIVPNQIKRGIAGILGSLMFYSVSIILFALSMRLGILMIGYCKQYCKWVTAGFLEHYEENK